MEKASFVCRICTRKTYQNLSNRCQYCGAELPEHMKMDDNARNAYLHKLERIDQESEEFARGMSKETLFEQELRRNKREEAAKKKGKMINLLPPILPGN